MLKTITCVDPNISNISNSSYQQLQHKNQLIYIVIVKSLANHDDIYVAAILFWRVFKQFCQCWKFDSR